MGQWREEGADILLQHQARFVLNSALVTDAYMALCLSQVSVLSKRVNELDRFLARQLPSAYPTLCCTEFRVSSKTRVLPSETFS